ncbi:MAG: stage V sporulation protein AE [Bacillota bacterium]
MPINLNNITIAFVVGGLICVVAQLVLDLTRLTPAHIMVYSVSFGAILSGLGIYQPLADFAGAGATIPLPGFGHALVQGITKATVEHGVVGLLTGGLTATALGVTAAIIFGTLMAILFNSRGK